MATTTRKKTGTGIVENLKKGLTELLVLKLLDEQPMSIYELIKIMREKSDEKCVISYPYAVIYRLQSGGFVTDAGKSVADDRLRFSYKITPEGKARLAEMISEYSAFTEGVTKILEG